MQRQERTRVVVTGIGAVSPFGVGIERLWAGLSRGEQPIRRLELFDVAEHRTHLAAAVPGAGSAAAFELPEAIRRRSPSPRTSRSDRFALVAALEAWTMAGLGEPGSTPAAGLFFGSSTGGMLEGEDAYRRMRRAGPERSRAKRFAAQPNGAPADEVARVFGLTGPTEVVASACAASTMALESALDALRSGEVDVALAGGADGICRTTFGGFNALGAIDPGPALPFRAERRGLSLGEGAAMLVLETEAHAAARGARPIAELAGAGSTCDAHHMTAPHPDGDGAARAVLLALEDAGVDAGDVSFVDAHGSGTPHNDRAESLAIRRVFGAGAASLPVTSSKGALGHGLGACGALEAVVTILCLERGAVHPTPGAGPVDPEAAVDLVLGAPRQIDPRGAGVSVNLAFGGANAAVVLSRLTAGAAR